jgi:hypothetical protein
MDFILEGLHDLVKVKVGQFSLAKELWYNLQNLYSKEYPTKHVDHDKEDAKIEREERISLGQID